jgi:hypothetical protein
MKSLVRTYRVRAAAFVCILVAVLACGCGADQKQQHQREPARPMKTIDEVIKTYSDSLMAIPGVVGLYHGQDDSGRTCLKVMVRQRTPEVERRIPERIEGYPVIIDETGEIKPMD